MSSHEFIVTEAAEFRSWIGPDDSIVLVITDPRRQDTVKLTMPPGSCGPTQAITMGAHLTQRICERGYADECTTPERLALTGGAE